MRLIGLVDQLSVHIWQDGDHRGRESEETIVERSTDLASRCFSFSSTRTWCRSLLLRFSTCYLGILGLDINCKLAWTSHQRTTSERGQKLCSQGVLYSEVPLYWCCHSNQNKEFHSSYFSNTECCPIWPMEDSYHPCQQAHTDAKTTQLWGAWVELVRGNFMLWGM